MLVVVHQGPATTADLTLQFHGIQSICMLLQQTWQVTQKCRLSTGRWPDECISYSNLKLKVQPIPRAVWLLLVDAISTLGQHGADGPAAEAALQQQFNALTVLLQDCHKIFMQD